MKTVVQILTFPTHSLHSPSTLSYSWSPCIVACTGGSLLIQQCYHPELTIRFFLQSFHLVWLFWPVVITCLIVAAEPLQICFQATCLPRKSGRISSVHLWFCTPRTLQCAVCECSVGQLRMGDEWGAEPRAHSARNMPLWVYQYKPWRCSQDK